MNLLNYRFTVSIRGTHIPSMCKYPRTYVKACIRRNKCIYEDDQLKCIIYPENLLYTYVDQYDVVENHILELQQMWPNWYTIRVDAVDAVDTIDTICKTL